MFIIHFSITIKFKKDVCVCVMHLFCPSKNLNLLLETNMSIGKNSNLKNRNDGIGGSKERVAAAGTRMSERTEIQ